MYVQSFVERILILVADSIQNFHLEYLLLQQQEI